MRDIVKVSNVRQNNSQRGRQQVAHRKKRRRGNMILYYIIFLLIVFTITIVLSLTVFFNIKSVEISGKSSYTSQQILEALNIKKGDNLFKLNTDKITDRVHNTLPEIETVKIKRCLPDKVKVTVTPAVATAIVDFGDKHYEVSENGKIIKEVETPDESLFKIDGIDPESVTPGTFIKSKDKDKNKIYETVVKEMKTLDFKNVTAIDLSDKQNIKFTYNNTIPVELGTSYDLSYKITFAKKVIDTQMPEGFSGKIVLVGNNFARLLTN